MSILIPKCPKQDSVINVRCTDSEKQTWIDSFGSSNVSATVRRLLNAAAAKKLKRESA
jgi:hypothetical protein